ncbi:FAD-binding protein [Vicingus serpentipes]|uniref:FAD-binding protein n=1 Tax=Vicingus serpentipes TaxID=1926625 RepID=A0A5C6RUV4_9FLAO|nr:FAD-dependent oxidoreductase [Vicingus serpentipes]TXB65745.1 FAD-binding protein [Vicingus serpentipes]
MRTIDIVVLPEEASNPEYLRKIISKEIREKEFEFVVRKRSIDARRTPVKFNLRIDIYINETIPPAINTTTYQNVANKKQVIVIGFGPAGMFAALKLIELGYQPIVLERGKDVRSRRRDLAAITKNQIVNPNSNYCFGEGGAGTYSDGKLYTRSKKRGDVNAILQVLVEHGADENILVDAHPHIGTNKLPKVVTDMRETVLKYGGIIHFETQVTDIILENNKIKGVIDQNNKTYQADQVILATGHSARDIFYLLDKKGIEIESKPFALGVRVEHSQDLIDAVQYHCDIRGEHLPPASYKLVQQVKKRGVFSFCMCPGGIIAPCATAPGEIVTNGWSPSKRNNPFANSGIVVTVEPEDLEPYKKYGALAGLKFQEAVERATFVGAGNDTITNNGQIAPAQRLIDFINNRTSTTLPDCSYKPGVVSAPLHSILPKTIVEHLQGGFKAFGNKITGYLNRDAIIVAVESRTSSPVKIPRDRELLEHPQIKGLYPCGEGAGYAGGIVSAAIDGQKCALAIHHKIQAQ